MSSSTPSVDFSRRSRLRTSLASCLALRCSSFARLVERNRAIDVLLRCPPGRDASYSKKTRRGPDTGVAAAVVEEIRAAGGEATPSLEPVGTVAAGEAIVRTALEAFGRLDVLVNNAGITASHPIEAFPEDAWARIVAVHLTG